MGDRNVPETAALVSAFERTGMLVRAVTAEDSGNKIDMQGVRPPQHRAAVHHSPRRFGARTPGLGFLYDMCVWLADNLNGFLFRHPCKHSAILDRARLYDKAPC